MKNNNNEMEKCSQYLEFSGNEKKNGSTIARRNILYKNTIIQLTDLS